MKISIGIDPGLDTGGLAMLTEEMNLMTIMTPRQPSRKVKNKTVKGDIDLDGITNFIMEGVRMLADNYPDNKNELHIFYEDVHSLFKSSASGNFSFGERKGEIRGIANAIKVICSDIYPNVDVYVDAVYSTIWQKEVIHFSDKVMSGGKVDTKATSINAAKRWFPNYKFTKEKGQKDQDGMTDATLIALYGLKTIRTDY